MSEFSKIMKIVNSYWGAQTLMVANDYNIFTHLHPNGITLNSLCKKISTKVDGTERLLNALVAMGLLQKKNKKYSNSSLTKQFLVKSSKDYRGEILRHYQDLWNSWCNLDKAVKSGFSDDFLKNNKFLKDKAKIRAFIFGLHNVGLESAVHVAKKLPLKNVKKMLDLGGGGGTFSIAIVNEKPDISVTIFDLPQILNVTKEIIKQNGKEQNIKTSPGDFNKISIPGKYDLILMSKVTHIEDRIKNTQIFKKCYKALNPGGRVAIHDFMLDKNHSGPVFSTLFSLNMLVRTPRGGVYSAEQYKEWLSIAGFEKFKTHSIPHQTKLLVATKK